MVFQHYALFPHMTVADNVGFGLTTGATRGATVRSPNAASRVAEMLRLVGLEQPRRAATRPSSRAARRSGWRSRGR